MTNESKKTVEKQNADLDRAAQKIARGGFTASEAIGEESSYEDETETARRMRRGDETKGDPDERDAAGAVEPADVAPEVGADKGNAE